MERMNFHTRVGQPALTRIGCRPDYRIGMPPAPLTRPLAGPTSASGEGSSVSHGMAFHGLQTVVHTAGGGQVQAGIDSQPARGFGFPIPGLQDPSPESVVGNDYFVRENEFDNILNEGDYDYIVIGSSFMALAFIQEAWERDANVRILVLERGRMWLPSHFQNLPLPFRLVLGGRAETFPWTLSEETFRNPRVPGLSMSFLRGSCPFFGGRSTIWSAWSPNPQPDRFRSFPQSMLDTMQEPDFWPKVNSMLNVKPANEIGGAFDCLQRQVDKILKENLANIPSAIASDPAMLAVGPNHSASSLRFTKYSVPGPMLSLVEKFRTQYTISGGGHDAPRQGKLQIVTDCVVKRLGALQKKHVRSVETSRGTLSFMSDNTKIILCAGAIPNTTLVLNSFPELRDVAGKRLTGHSMSHFTARVAKEALSQTGDNLQIAANYLHGEAKKQQTNEHGLQYHVQITAIYCPRPEEQIEDLTRECPDFAAAPTLEQLATSTDKVVFVCATLGEMEEGGNSRVQWSGGPDPTTNVTVHYEYTQADRDLWDLYDAATFQTLDVMRNGYELEYWHEGKQGAPGTWKATPPEQSELRIPGVVHEASTLFMDYNWVRGSVNADYLLHGTDNVYVTGAALFPTCGSWNPTAAMCGFARDLAKKIVPKLGRGN